MSRAINGKRKGVTQSTMSTLTKREWIAEQAKEHPERVFTSLHHLIDLEWMIVASADEEGRGSGGGRSDGGGIRGEP